jgi:DNA-binding transcriptional ArsR family regulator
MAATDTSQDPEADLADWISGGRHDILRAIRFHGGEANTSEIKDYSGIARGSFDHHIKLLLNPPESVGADIVWLEGEGLIEETGRVGVGTPVPARQFGLTDAGEKAFEMSIGDVSIRADDVRDLQQRVEELESQSGNRQGSERERIEELEAENEELKGRFNHMADVVEDMMDGDDSPSV